jgi:hypothetical protein
MSGYANCLHFLHILDRLFSVNVNYMSVTPRHVKLVVIAYHKAVISTPYQPVLNVSYLHIMCISTASGNSCRTGGSPSTSRRNRRAFKAEKPIQSPTENKTVVRHTSVYWCDCRETCRTKGSRDGVLNEGKGLSIRKCFIHYKHLFGPVTNCACPICVCSTRTQGGKTQVAEERDLAFGIIYILTLVANKFTACGEMIFRWTHQKSYLRVSIENYLLRGAQHSGNLCQPEVRQSRLKI